jgi:hypothetical protein
VNPGDDQPIDLAAAAAIYRRSKRRVDPNDRFHQVGPATYPSVTGIIHAVLRSPSLDAWLLKGRVAAYRTDLIDTLSRAKTPKAAAWAIRECPFPLKGRDMGNAAEIGTAVHHAIEWALKGEMGLDPGPMPTLGPIEADCFARWSVWWATAGLRPLALEQELVCKACGFAGHADLIAEVVASGRQCILDWKTSKDVYPDYRLQLSAYGHCSHIPLGGVVRIGKDPDEDVEVTWVDDLPALFPHFAALLSMWRWLRGLSGHDTGTPPTGDHALLPAISTPTLLSTAA